MKVPFEINEKKFLVSPYNTFKEKELLLSSSFGVEDPDKILEILGFQDMNPGAVDSLSEDEKKVIIYKFREISLGDEIEVKFICDNCGQGNDGVLEASEFVIPGERSDPEIKKTSRPFSEENMGWYVGMTQEELDDMDIDEYENLRTKIEKNQTKISFVKSCKCLMCKASKNFDLSSPKYIIEILSDDSLMTLYKSYNFMIYFGHYSKEDIDNMYPFERSIFIGLLNKTKEDLSK